MAGFHGPGEWGAEVDSVSGIRVCVWVGEEEGEDGWVVVVGGEEDRRAVF